MPRGWEALPTPDGDGRRPEPPAERLRAACKPVGMVLLGLSIGCMFVLVRELFGIKT